MHHWLHFFIRLAHYSQLNIPAVPPVHKLHRTQSKSGINQGQLVSHVTLNCTITVHIVAIVMPCECVSDVRVLGQASWRMEFRKTQKFNNGLCKVRFFT